MIGLSLYKGDSTKGSLSYTYVVVTKGNLTHVDKQVYVNTK